MTDGPSLDSPIGGRRLREIYSRTAAFYDGLVAADQSRAKEAGIRLLNRQRGERFLEVGVGTAWAFARVVAASGVAGAAGVDLAEGMLAVARRRLRDEEGLRQAPLILADACALPFAGVAFDCLLTSYTLEVLPSHLIPAVLAECHRVLRPGGRLVAVNLTDGEADDAAFTDDWKRRYALDPEYFGGARPIRASTAIRDADFERLERRYVGPEWPSEVIRAWRPTA